MGDDPLPFDPELVQAELRRRAEDDFLTFVASLIIPSAMGPRLFREVMAEISN